MELNFLVILGSALIPIFLGFLWYNPKLFGNVWMKAADMTEAKMEGANMPLIFGISFVLSVFLAFGMSQLVVHQTDILALFISDPTFADNSSAAHQFYAEIMDRLGDKHRNFGHGVLHGAILTIVVVLPVLGTNALFERKGFKYIAVNVGYWLVCLMLMGGVLCQFS